MVSQEDTPDNLAYHVEIQRRRGPAQRDALTATNNEKTVDIFRFIGRIKETQSVQLNFPKLGWSKTVVN